MIFSLFDFRFCRSLCVQYRCPYVNIGQKNIILKTQKESGHFLPLCQKNLNNNIFEC